MENSLPIKTKMAAWWIIIESLILLTIAIVNRVAYLALAFLILLLLCIFILKRKGWALMLMILSLSITLFTLGIYLAVFLAELLSIVVTGSENEVLLIFYFDLFVFGFPLFLFFLDIKNFYKSIRQ